MKQYLFVHTPTGRSGKVSEEHLEAALLEVVGGGYTEAQVAMAMVLRAELMDGEMARSALFTITPLPIDVTPNKETAPCL